MHVHLWVLWLLVRRVNARETLDLALPSLLVQPLRVAPFNDVQRSINEHLQKRKICLLVHFASIFAVGRIWRDEAGDDDGASFSKQLRHFCDTAHVLCLSSGVNPRSLFKPKRK